MKRLEEKIIKHLENIQDERVDLIESVNSVINNISSCVDMVKQCPGKIKTKDLEALLHYEMELVTQLSQLNYKFMQFTCNQSVPKIELYNENLESNKDESKTSNSEMLQDKLKPLDDNLLETLCAHVIRKLKASQIVPSQNQVQHPNNSNEVKPQINKSVQTCSLNLSSDTDLSEAVLDVHDLPVPQGHPLAEMQLPASLPDELNTQEIDSIRLNLQLLSSHMGFDEKSFFEMNGLYSKTMPSSNFDYQKPERDVHVPTYGPLPERDQPFTVRECNESIDVPTKTENVYLLNTDIAEIVQLHNNIEGIIEASVPRKETDSSHGSTGLLIDTVISNKTSLPDELAPSCQYGPEDSSSDSVGIEMIKPFKTLSSSSYTPESNCSVDIALEQRTNKIENNTGAIKKITTDLIEFSNSDSESECGKQSYTALEKLNKMHILDRNEEARKEAIKVLPDLRLMPVERPAVIKNNLDFTVETKENTRQNTNKSIKEKNCNHENVIHELKRKIVPEVGTLCAFSHIESPSEFYIHIVDNETTIIDKLTEEISSLCKDTVCYSSKEEALSKIGKFCFAYILSYMGWYRVQVLDWYLTNNSDEVLVQLVDYGNKSSVSYRNLRKMTKNMADIPMLAVRCHLPLLYPPGSTSENLLTEWPDSAIESLSGMSGLFDPNGECIIFKIIYAYDEKDSVAIDLYDLKDGNENDTVGQLMLELGQAIEVTFDDYEDEYLAEFLEDIDLLERPENINEAILGYDARDEARICKFTRPDGSCYKGKHCKLEHKQLSQDGYTSDKVPVFYTCTNDLLLPRQDENVLVLVTEYRNSCSYFVQMVRSPEKLNGYYIDKELYHLLKTMNHNKVISTYQTMKVWPAIGEVVIIKHWTKKWLRGIVRDLICDTHGDLKSVQVCMVDFGDTCEVSLKDIRQMKEEFIHLPFQRIEIYLKDYQEAANCDKSKARQFFDNNISFHNFFAQIMSRSAPYAVKLTTFKGHDVGKTLVKESFAEKRKFDFNGADGPIHLE